MRTDPLISKRQVCNNERVLPPAQLRQCPHQGVDPIWRIAIPAAVDLLSSLPVAFEGAVTREVLTPDLAELRVSRVATTQGPVGCVLAVASVDQPIVRRLESKWRKTYETSRPVELLAYFGVQPVGALDSWLPAVQEFVEHSWASSAFQRLWVCDLSIPSVIWFAERRAA